MKRKILTLILGSLVSFGCSSKKESSLRITMPSGDFPNFEKSVMSMSGTTSQWNSGLDPVNINDINCYGIIVSGPEPFMQVNFALRENGESVPFGPWVAAVPEGGSVELMVPSGKERQIYLLGFRANSSGSCYDFEGVGPDYDNLSRPYVVGTASLSLEPGDVEVDLNISMSGAYALTEFHGPGFGAPGISNATQFFGDARHGDQTIASPIGNVATDTSLLPAGRRFMPSTRVTNIDNTGRVLTIANTWADPTDLEAGDEVFWIVAGSFRTGVPERGCGLLSDLTLGSYGFAKVESTNLGSNQFTTVAPITSVPLDNVALANPTLDGTTPFCYINAYRVPQFDNLTLTNTGTLDGAIFDYSANSHGALVMKVNGTLTLSGGNVALTTIGRGFNGGGAGNGGAGSLGLPTGPAARGNASDGNSNTSEGSSGGANNGDGGDGTQAGQNGVRGILCANGAGDCPPGMKLFFGGASGGSQIITGRNGGGIIVIHARRIDFNGNNLTLAADGDPGGAGAPGEGGSGGAGGGGVLVSTQELINASGNSLILKAHGGDGGNGGAGGSGGGGGGAGAVELQSCHSPLDAGLTLDSRALGGAFGTGTTNGMPGQDGHGPNPLGVAGNIGDYSIIHPLLCEIP